ncbi:MAG: filament integrity protein FraC [Spirulina sp.]
MSPTDVLADLGLLPLKAIVFQSMLLMVAIALEAMVLRQHLRLGYQTSVQYAATINLLATSLGWIAFLSLEAVLPTALRQQIMSYVLFSRFFPNDWLEALPVMMVMVAIVVFFATYWVKLQSLSALVALLGKAPVLEAPGLSDRAGRNRSSRRGAPSSARSRTATYTVAVLQANALSFTVIVLLLFLQLQVVLP